MKDLEKARTPGHNAGLSPIKETEKKGSLDRKTLWLLHNSEKCSARSRGNLAPKLPIRRVPGPRTRLH